MNFVGQFFGSNFSRTIQRAIVCPGQNHFENWQADRFPCKPNLGAVSKT
jgi:hypothetical protein